MLLTLSDVIVGWGFLLFDVPTLFIYLGASIRSFAALCIGRIGGILRLNVISATTLNEGQFIPSRNFPTLHEITFPQCLPVLSSVILARESIDNDMRRHAFGKFGD